MSTSKGCMHGSPNTSLALSARKTSSLTYSGARPILCVRSLSISSFYSTNQPHLSITTLVSTSQLRRSSSNKPLLHVQTNAVTKSCVKSSDDDNTADTEALLQVGFTYEQVAQILHYLRSHKHTFSVSNTLQWLELLQSHEVERPAGVLSKFPITLLLRANNAAVSVQAILAWLSGRGLTVVELGNGLGRWPVLLLTSIANIIAVQAKLTTELCWDDDQITKVLLKNPSIFNCSPLRSLAPKLAWFESQGFSTRVMGRLVFINLALMLCTTCRSQQQLLALKALGLSQLEVVRMVTQLPTLLSKKIDGATIQAKVQFLTSELEKSITELVVTPVFLNRSLSKTIGPH